MKRVTSRAAVALAVLVAVASALGAGIVAAQEEVMNPTQSRMRGVFLTLTSAYKFSLDAEAFEDPVNRGNIRASLQALVANAAELETHGGGLDPSFDYLRRSLSKDAMQALERFEQRQFVGARFLLTRITENCVTCHSKIPDEGGFELGAQFVKESGIRELAPIERVDIEIATRQFNRALRTLEGIFQDRDEKPQTLSLVGAFERYIRLCVAVVEDHERATKTLTVFQGRKDVAQNFKTLISSWITDLETLDLAAAEGNELFVSRNMIEKARAAKRFSEDRSDLVEFIAAAALLHRYLQAGDALGVGKDEQAEAFYLLAVAEANISRSYWVSETASLLEQAIHTAPKSAVAREAYAFLEEYTLAGHSVTAREVPDDIEQTLDSLRTIIGE
jgi:hypothetical protein